MTDRVSIEEAYEELVQKLFGSSLSEITDIASMQVSREKYETALKEVQETYGLKQGHPDFLEWLFTCVGRSPIIVETEAEGG